MYPCMAPHVTVHGARKTVFEFQHIFFNDVLTIVTLTKKWGKKLAYGTEGPVIPRYWDFFD